MQSNCETASPISLWTLALTFLRLGAVTFGGLYAATNSLEKQFVDEKGWLEREDIHALIVTATLIPAPKFLSFVGLIGFKLRGWAGSAVSIICLFIPAASLVLFAVIAINPSLLSGALQPLQRLVSIAITGLLFGNAVNQYRNTKFRGTKKTIGTLLAVAIAVSVALGAPLFICAVVGFGLGYWLLKEPVKKQSSDESKEENAIG